MKRRSGWWLVGFLLLSGLEGSVRGQTRQVIVSRAEAPEAETVSVEDREATPSESMPDVPGYVDREGGPASVLGNPERLDPMGRSLPRGDFRHRARSLSQRFAGGDPALLRDFRAPLFLRSAVGSSFTPIGLRFGTWKGALSAVPVIPILSESGGRGNSKLYWTDAVTGKIQRANLDGSGVEDLVTGLSDPFGLTLDLEAGKLYWTDAAAHKIQRANLDGSEVEDLVTGLRTPYGLAVGGSKMYWSDRFTRKIQRANLDGTQVEDLVTAAMGLGEPVGLALDLGGNRLYWSDGFTRKIQRANLDGTRMEDLVTGLGGPEGLALDPGGGKLYWTDRTTDKIQRANLDGSGVEDLVTTGLREPAGLALDLVLPQASLSIAPASIERGQSATLTWSSPPSESATLLPGIGAVPTSGSRRVSPARTTTYRLTVRDAAGQTASATAIVTVTDPPPDLVVDSVSVSRPTLRPSQSFELRATVRNQGGRRSAATTLRYYRSDDPAISTGDMEVGPDAVSGLPASGASVESIRLTAPSSAGTDYYYGACVDHVGGESPDGSNCSPGVRVTVIGGKLYWTDEETKKIQRANLDGSGLEDVITGLNRPVGLGVDPGGGKLYWTDWGTDTGKVQRANLDGSQVEDLVTVTTGLGEPYGLALDPGGGKLYWTDTVTNKVQRANLDGTRIEDLVTTGLSRPYGLALDPGGGKLYWADWGTDKIQRANLDGSEVEDLITTGLGEPFGLAVDPVGGKLYWTAWRNTDKIQRANLDGSGVEDFVAGLAEPFGLALALDPVPTPVNLTEGDDAGWCAPPQTVEVSFRLRENGKTVSICREKVGTVVYYFGTLEGRLELEYRGPVLESLWKPVSLWGETAGNLATLATSIVSGGSWSWDSDSSEREIAAEISEASRSRETKGFYFIHHHTALVDQSVYVFRRGGWEYIIESSRDRDANTPVVENPNSITLISPEGEIYRLD